LKKKREEKKGREREGPRGEKKRTGTMTDPFSHHLDILERKKRGKRGRTR